MTESVAEQVEEYLRDPYYLAFLLIIGAAAYLRFQHAFFQGIWVDEGRYGRLAIEVSSHLLSFSTIEAWKGQVSGTPPVYTYLLALATYLPLKTDTAIRIVSPLMGTAGVGITYFLGREMKNREVGLLAAAMLAVSPVFWFLSERILIGATLTTVYTVTAFCLYYGLEDRAYSRYALWALGPMVVVSILTKQPAYTLGLVAPIYFLYKKREELKQLLLEEVEFTESRFYQETLLDRDYYIMAGLGLLTIAPWALRNLTVCSFPLCGLSRAAKFAEVSSVPEWASTGGPFYFILNLPAVVTLPVSLLIAFRVGQYLFEWTDRDPDMLIKYVASTAALLGLSYFITPKLVPMVLLASVALYATSDAEKLLWVWIGIGIGFMSIPPVKVPRYIVFTVPALLTVASLALYSIGDWLSYQLDTPQLTAPRIAAILLLPILFMSFSQGAQNISKGGFAEVEPAGRWLDQNAPEDSSIAASSPSILRYYIHPRMAYKLPNNESRLESFIEEKGVSYVEVDYYERAQPRWSQTGLPPYRLPVSTVNDLRSGEISARQVASSYGQPPEYLVPVKSFGQTRIPLTRQKQPMVVIYRVNRSVLE